MTEAVAEPVSSRLSMWLKGTLALAAGTGFSFGLAPFDWWPSLIGSILLLHWLLRGVSVRHGLVIFYAYGVGFYGVGVSWVYVSIHEFGGASILLAGLLVLLFVLAMALFFLAQGYIYLKFFRQSIWGITLGFSAIWVLREWLLTWFLTGFPWLFAGYGLLDTWLAGYAPMLGVLGVSYMALLQTSLLACALGRLLSLREISPPVLVTVTLVPVIWLGGWFLEQTRFVEPTGTTLTVSAIQGNVDQHSKWTRAMMAPILRTYTGLSETEWGRDLIVWPEAAVTVFRSSADSFLAPLDARGRATGTALILGIPDRDPQGYFLNSAIALGRGEGSYIKRRLVPFGEYVPLESQLRGLIQLFDLPMSHNISGPQNQAAMQVGDVSISLSICYEVIYPDLVRKTTPDPDVFITISNDSWFGASIGPWQHLQMARMRALENGRYLIRATNNGVTAVIDERGQLVAQLPQFVPGVLRADVGLMFGSTPFARYGHAGILVLLLASLIAVRFALPRRLTTAVGGS
jgi:apolipoprotein N-acyltransferase